MSVDTRSKITGIDNDPIYVGSWASKPLPTDVNTGDQIVVTDIGVGGRSFWWSDGTYWRPVNNRAVLYQRMSSLAVPLATIAHTDASVRLYTLPETLKLPAGILSTPNTVLALSVIMYRVAAGAGAGTIFPVAKLGTTNSITDRNSMTWNFGAAVGAGVFGYWETTFPTAGSNTGPQINNLGVAALSASNHFDLADATYNTASDMYVNFAINAGAVSGDTTALGRYTIEIRG